MLSIIEVDIVNVCMCVYGYGGGGGGAAAAAAADDDDDDDVGGTLRHGRTRADDLDNDVIRRHASPHQPERDVAG